MSLLFLLLKVVVVAVLKYIHQYLQDIIKSELLQIAPIQCPGGSEHYI